MTFIGPIRPQHLGTTSACNIYWIDTSTGEHYWYNNVGCYWVRVGNWLKDKEQRWLIRIIKIMGCR